MMSNDPETLKAVAPKRTVTIQRHQSSFTREAEYIKTATAQGAVVLLKWGPLQTLYRFSAKTGKGTGPAKLWRIVKSDLPKVRDWARGVES